MKLSTGTYLDTDEKTYRSWPGINYSALSRFSESQDHCLMVKPAKSYFAEGTAFELLIEDAAKGSLKFEERFFVADAPGVMPEDLAGWIDGKKDLETKYRLKKDGGLNMQSVRLHAWLDACRDHPGMMPMGKDQIEMLSKMVDNFMLMQPFADQGQEETLAEILPLCDFQVPVLWYVGEMLKKALIDCMFMTDNKIYVFDIKTTFDLKRFAWMLKDKYWIQEAHYTVGLQSIFPDKEIVWRFLVSSKAEPWLSQPFCVDPFSMSDNGVQAYYDLCTAYYAWVEDGRPPKGWKELESVKVFFN